MDPMDPPPLDHLDEVVEVSGSEKIEALLLTVGLVEAIQGFALDAAAPKSLGEIAGASEDLNKGAGRPRPVLHLVWLSFAGAAARIGIARCGSRGFLPRLEAFGLGALPSAPLGFYLNWRRDCKTAIGRSKGPRNNYWNGKFRNIEGRNRRPSRRRDVADEARLTNVLVDVLVALVVVLVYVFEFVKLFHHNWFTKVVHDTVWRFMTIACGASA